MGLRVNLGTLEEHVSLQTSYGQSRRGGVRAALFTDMAQRARNLEKESSAFVLVYLVPGIHITYILSYAKYGCKNQITCS